jgi:hypothetical protein
MNIKLEGFIAPILFVAALAVCGWLGWQQIQLRGEAENAETALNNARDSAAVATLNNLALPPSRVLSVCNRADEPLRISALAAVYAGKGGDLETFNSARQGWQTWIVPAKREQPMQLNSAQGGWPGLALFYAMDVEDAGGTDRMFAGTADELTGACIPLSGAKR